MTRKGSPLRFMRLNFTWEIDDPAVRARARWFRAHPLIGSALFVGAIAAPFVAFLVFVTLISDNGRGGPIWAFTAVLLIAMWVWVVIEVRRSPPVPG